MKVRSFVLLACMLVVPGLALFSHLTPPSARDLLRRAVCDPLHQIAKSATASLPFSASGAATGPRPSSVSVARPESSQASRPPLVPVPDAPAPARPETSPSPSVAVSDRASSFETLPMVTVSDTLADDTAPVRGVPASPVTSDAVATMRSRLTALGAMAIDCKPQPGESTGFASSCRIGIDREGQLQRIFNGRGPTEAEAMRSLLEGVEDWRTTQAGVLRHVH